MKTYEPIKDEKTARFVKKYDDGYGARNTTLTVSISDELKNEVRALANKENESLSNMVNIILADYLKGGQVKGGEKTSIFKASGALAVPVAIYDRERGKYCRVYDKGKTVSKKYFTERYELKEVL